MKPVLSVHDLSIAFGAGKPVVNGVSFALERGNILGIVGESGSGKTTVALSLLGHRPPGTTHSGSVLLDGLDMLALEATALRAVRGRRISYVPQNPTTALNPGRTIGSLVSELMNVHAVTRTAAETEARVLSSLREFGFPEPEPIITRYPHQLSGGQQQRIALMMATVCDPAVVVLDEPTTGLDVSTQKNVLELLVRLGSERKTAMVYVTHDLSVLREIATHIGVLYAGRLLEMGPIEAVFEKPLHPYTRGLLASRLKVTAPGLQRPGLRGLLKRDELPAGCVFAPRCGDAASECWTNAPSLLAIDGRQSVACHRWRLSLEAPPPIQLATKTTANPDQIVLSVDDLSVEYRTSSNLSLLRKPPVRAVHNASLRVGAGEILAIVGESGSGKSTLAKAIAGLVPAHRGHIGMAGQDLAFDVARRIPQQRRDLQLIFQNPDSSLNPRRRIGKILTDALLAFERPDRRTIAERICSSLAEVKLPEDYSQRYPEQLSGGERQRVAIARALIVGPKLLICDEVLSALDVSVQAGILELLRTLCRERGVAILFISHDLAVVRAIAHRIAVLYRGEFVALTTPDTLLAPPTHPYLHEMLAALPGETIVAQRRPTPARHMAAQAMGCAFTTRCPARIDSLCEIVSPPWRGTLPALRCHQPEGQLQTIFPFLKGSDDE